MSDKTLKTRTATSVEEEMTPDQKLAHWQSVARQLQAENERLHQQIGGDEALFESIKGGVGQLAPYPRLALPKPKRGVAEHTAVAIITDTHSDEYVNPAEMEGMASHTWETHTQRMALFADKVIEITNIMRESASVPNLAIWLLGDFFIGQIHAEEGAYGETMTMPQALPAEGQVLADTIMRMARGFDKVRVVGICGNHGRNTHKPVFKMTADRNWDMSVYLIAQQIARAQENAEWVLPKSIMHVEDVMGWKELLTHGNVANVTHRTPYFGIEDSFFKQRDARRKTTQDFDHVWVGHFHHEFTLRGFIRGCPSMIGANQFSQYKMHCASAAQQRLVMFTEKHGPTSEWLINL